MCAIFTRRVARINYIDVNAIKAINLIDVSGKRVTLCAEYVDM